MVNDLRGTFGSFARDVFRIIAIISLILLMQVPCLIAASISHDEQTLAFDPNNMDRSIHPGDDFYKYVNGGWIENNPVPSDKTKYNEFKIVEDKTNEQVRKLVEQASNNTTAKEEQPGLEDRSVLPYRHGYGFNKPTGYRASSRRAEIHRQHYHIKRCSEGLVHLLSYYIIDPFFSFFAAPDSKNSKMVIATLYQSGLGLPDRDYYLRPDNESAKTREDYLKFVTRMFVLLGNSSENASKDAETVMRTRLAWPMHLLRT